MLVKQFEYTPWNALDMFCWRRIAYILCAITARNEDGLTTVKPRAIKDMILNYTVSYFGCKMRHAWKNMNQ